MKLPVCLDCMVFFRPKQNSVVLEEGSPRAQPDGTETWEGYRLWAADLFACPGCGAQIVTGFAKEPLAIRHQREYARLRDRLQPLGRVDDC